MTLAEYKTLHALRLRDLAQQLSRPVTTVHGWLNGRRVPTIAEASRIQQLTHGAVTVADWAPLENVA